MRPQDQVPAATLRGAESQQNQPLPTDCFDQTHPVSSAGTIRNCPIPGLTPYHTYNSFGTAAEHVLIERTLTAPETGNQQRDVDHRRQRHQPERSGASAVYADNPERNDRIRTRFDDERRS